MTRLDFSTAWFSLDTPRMCVRPMTPSDESVFKAIYTDAETMRMIGKPLSDAEAGGLFTEVIRQSSLRSPRSVFMVIESKRSHAPVGLSAAMQIDFGERSAEIGLMLLRDAVDRYLGAVALKFLIGGLFELLALDEVWSRHPQGHRLARRVAAGVGLRPGPERHPSDDGQPMQYNSLSRTQWSAMQAGVNTDTGAAEEPESTSGVASNPPRLSAQPPAAVDLHIIH